MVTHLDHVTGPEAMRRILAIRAFFVDLTMAATAARADTPLVTPLPCRRRPGHRPCQGILGVRRSKSPAEIRYECVRCGAGGVLHGYEGTEWDLGQRRPRLGEPPTMLVYPVAAHGALCACVREHADWRALVHRATLHRTDVHLLLPQRLTPAFVAFLQQQLRELRGRRKRALEVILAAAPARARARDGEPARRRRSKAGAPPPSCHQLRIALDHVRPSVWRRLRVPSDLRLPELHRVLQAVMGWTDSHLHAFQAGGRTFLRTDADELMREMGEDERRVTLAQIAPHAGAQFVYEYDFGDDWQHAVRVEEIGPAAGPVLACLAGQRACPPEDCGGPHGYAELLSALGDPAHEEHEELLEWAGGPIDPERFDLDEVNARLHVLARRLPTLRAPGRHGDRS